MAQGWGEMKRREASRCLKRAYVPIVKLCACNLSRFQNLHSIPHGLHRSQMSRLHRWPYATGGVTYPDLVTSLCLTNTRTDPQPSGSLQWKWTTTLYTISTSRYCTFPHLLHNLVPRRNLLPRSREKLSIFTPQLTTPAVPNPTRHTDGRDTEWRRHSRRPVGGDAELPPHRRGPGWDGALP